MHRHTLAGLMLLWLAIIQAAPAAMAQADKFAGLRLTSDNIVYGAALGREDYQAVLQEVAKGASIRKGLYEIHFEKSSTPCPTVISARIFVNRSPTTHYSRESLWSEYRPLAREIAEAQCPNLDALIASGRNVDVYARLYFSGTYFTNDFLPHFGAQPSGALIMPFADVRFQWLPPSLTKSGEEIDGPYALPGFTPTIFGYQGASNKAKWNLEQSRPSLLKYRLSAPGLAAGAQAKFDEMKRLSEADYRDFPKFNFLESVNANTEWMLRQDRYWKARADRGGAIQRWLDRLSSGDPETWALTLRGVSDMIDRSQCAQADLQGFPRPWWCENL